MKLSRSLAHAFRMVIHSKIRSWLTILGIVIGVGSVIAIVSLGDAMEASVNSQMDDLGGDLLTVTPGYSSGSSMRMMKGPGGDRQAPGSSTATEEEVILKQKDVQALRTIPDISLIDTYIKGNVDVAYMGKSGSVSLTGVDQTVWSQITTSEIAEGRMLDSADKNVIVIGGKLADGYFDKAVGLNQMLTIDGSSYRVVGILDDTRTDIYMPISMAIQIIDDAETGEYDSIIVKVKNEDTINQTMTTMEEKLMISRLVNEKDRDFTITSNAQLSEARAEMMSSMTMFLTAIAAVSLLVGAVGIANTMFTSVLEKTKDIGIMKAIGARNSDILFIFLFNAALIGLVGGLLGVGLGIILSGALPSLMSGLPFARDGTLVTLDSVLMALGVSIVVGIVAGIVPAFQASKLRPVDALRYE